MPLFALLTSVTLLAGDSWPGFRGPSGDGRSDAKNVVAEWSEKDNVVWKTAIHGKGWSSPIVVGNEVWLTTADEVLAETTQPAKKGGPPANPVKEVSFFAIGVDRTTGKVVKDVKLGTEQNPAYCHPFNSYASPTPCFDDGRIYAHFGSHGTWCVEAASGKIVWERKDLKCDHFRGPASSPVVHGGLLFLIFDGFDLQYVTALDKTTGRTVWKTDRKIKYSTDNGDYKKAYATPAVFDVNGRQLLICPSAECTMAYDPKTGEELWRIAHGGMNGSARVVMGNGLLYLTSGHTGRLLAVKADAKPDQSGFLPKEAVVWTAMKGVPTRPSLLLDGSLLYMVSDTGIASCLDATTGKVVWSERLDGEFSASPVLANGQLYCCNQTGKTFVLALGKVFSVTAENRLGEGKDAGFMASPAIAGDAIFLRSKGYLYAIGKKP
jgi:outer membrane protein assembly factor BamB